MAQLSAIAPEKPIAGQEITLSYLTKDEKAVLPPGEAVYARITSYGSDGGIVKQHRVLNPQGDILTAKYRLPEQAASVKVEFYTLNKEDEKAAQQFLVYTADHRLPVQGAYQEGLFTDRPDSVLQRELANYPRNYLAYAQFINVAAMIKDPDVAKKQIGELLAYLHQATERGPGWLAALCVGYAKTADLVTGKKYLFELFSRFPATQEAAFAFSIYNYEYYKASAKDVEEDVRQQLKAIFVTHPDAPISRSENVFHYLEKEPGLTVSDFERVLLPLWRDSLVSYHGFSNLPEVYIAHKERLDVAESLLKQGIALFQEGTVNHQFRLNNDHYQLFVPILLMDLTQLDLLKMDTQAAIIHSSAAINILAGSNTEGNLMPLLLPLRASAFQRSGNFNLAMEDYKQWHRLGNPAALDSMKRIFARCSTKQTTFDDFVATLRPGTEVKSKLPMAPEITAFDLKGKMVRLSDLKGKLVVINIWGIGCGPCIAEMPELNKLAAQFPDRDKVVFLGIAGDPTERLVKFLKTHTYAYTVVNKATGLAEKFNTNSLPVHLVIGKQGEIISRSIGARPDIKAYLSGVISSNW